MGEEDDTFDIDLYGNEEEQQQEQKDDLYKNDDTMNGGNTTHDGTADQKKDASMPNAGADDEIDFSEPPEEKVANPNGDQTEQPAQAPQQGIKRKAPDDDDDVGALDTKPQPALPNKSNSRTLPMDPNATPALKLGELHWWTSEEDLRAFCAQADTESELRDLSFGEHKVNGKAKGEAYLEFASPEAANATKLEVEREVKSEGESVAKNAPYQVSFTMVGNPFRNAKDAGGTVGGARKDFNSQQAGNGRGGAYNSFNNRGGFANRGGYGQNNRGGGGGYNNGGYQNRMGNQSQQGGWGMNGQYGGGTAGGSGFGAMGGGFNGMMYTPAQMMGMMGRGMGGMGAMMGGMSGMGGMGGMNGMNGMGGMRGGGGMMGSGSGWNNGGGAGMMGQGGGFNGGGGGYGQQGQQNKRSKME